MDPKQLDRIEAKLDTLDKRQDKMDVHLAVYNEQLKIHIIGVQDNRAEIKRVDSDVAKVDKRLSTHIGKVEGALKLIGLIATIAGIAAGIVKVLEFLKP
jgi:hypothetical protein